MKMKKLTTLLVAAGSLLSLAACGGGGSSRTPSSSNEIYVCVYDGGYGTAWIEQIAKDYEADTGIKVNWDADDTILDRVEDQLKNGSDYDIIMSHDINWQNYAALGYLENLDSVYDSNVYGLDVKLKDRVVDGALEMSKCEGETEGEEHYYKVCYTQGAGGLVYNMDMFEENGWNVPTTYEELVTLCNTIVEAKVSTGNRGEYVKPFAWAGNDRQYYWDYLVFEWWAQLAGMEKINTIREYKGTDGKYSSGYEMYNPETYYKEFVQAYDMWYQLVALNDKYSTTNAYAQALSTAKAAFVNGQAAMIPYAQWAKYELEQVAEGGKLSFDFAMMKAPKAKADAQDVNYMVGFGDSMIIPANAPAKELAKDFLRYMAGDKACKTFTEKSEGAFLAFDYSDIDMQDLKNDTYINSVYNKLTTSKDFTLASNSPLAVWTTNSVMPWVANKYYYAEACKTPADNTAKKVGDAIYNTARENWVVWCRNAGVSGQ